MSKKGSNPNPLAGMARPMPSTKKPCDAIDQKALRVERERQLVSYAVDVAVEKIMERVVSPVLDLIQSDPHQWSRRPCPTCHTISSMVERPFGCELKRTQHNRRDTDGQKTS